MGLNLCGEIKSGDYSPDQAFDEAGREGNLGDFIKVFILYKKGDKSDPNNYRGISIANAIAKLYDMVICERL